MLSHQIGAVIDNHPSQSKKQQTKQQSTCREKPAKIMNEPRHVYDSISVLNSRGKANCPRLK